MKSAGKCLKHLPKLSHFRRQQASDKNADYFCSSEVAFHSCCLVTTIPAWCSYSQALDTSGAPRNSSLTISKLLPTCSRQVSFRANFQAWLTHCTYERHWPNTARNRRAPPKCALQRSSISTWKFLEGEKRAYGEQPWHISCLPPSSASAAISLAHTYNR